MSARVRFVVVHQSQPYRSVVAMALREKCLIVQNRSDADCGLAPYSAECLWLSAEFPLMAFS
jgi:hypothetical protein